MTISEYLNNIKDLPNYVFNSLHLKAADNSGCTYKYLIKQVDGSSSRKQIFIALDEVESNLELLDKTIIKSIEVYPAL
jgi:hypothetical protein